MASFGTDAPNGTEGPWKVLASRGVEHELREETLKRSETVGGESVRVAPNSMGSAGIPGDEGLRPQACAGSEESNTFATSLLYQDPVTERNPHEGWPTRATAALATGQAHLVLGKSQT